MNPLDSQGEVASQLSRLSFLRAIGALFRDRREEAWQVQTSALLAERDAREELLREQIRLLRQFSESQMGALQTQIDLLTELLKSAGDKERIEREYSKRVADSAMMATGLRGAADLPAPRGNDDEPEPEDGLSQEEWEAADWEEEVKQRVDEIVADPSGQALTLLKEAAAYNPRYAEVLDAYERRVANHTRGSIQ